MWAVAATSACFGLMHIEWLHALLAFLLALYLGFITELSGSALPAVVAHVVNNTLFTLLTALGGTVSAFAPNVALLVAGVVVFVGCVVLLRRTLAPRSRLKRLILSIRAMRGLATRAATGVGLDSRRWRWPN